ncbi:MAG: hypothetical protein J6023_05355 [Clostridia bacterium]|nr:hypothetical protein [Clostridia bacterium]
MFSIKKACLAILLLLCLLIPLASCGQSGDPQSPDGTQSQTDSETSSADSGEKLYIVQDGTSLYRIIRSDTSKMVLTQECGNLYKEITSGTGAKITITTDYDTEEDPSIPEIIVGKCKRSVSTELLSGLPAQGFVFRTVGSNLVILGTTDELSALAVQIFLEQYGNQIKQGEFAISADLNYVMDYQSYKLSQDLQGSPLKKQYSDYIDTYTEDQLLSFDELTVNNVSYSSKFERTLDTKYQREGTGALRFELPADTALEAAMWFSSQNGPFPFSFSVEDTHKTTLKFWLYVDDCTKISCDHDSDTTVFSDQATFFFRVFDSKGVAYCWNHTLQGDGWHEVELSFNIHNGIGGGFDYSNIVNFGVLVAGKEGAMFELDDLRVVKYRTDYVPEQLPNNARLITSGECDALDGVIIQEWYGCSYDKDIKFSGKSSIRYEGDSTNSDHRAIIANLDMEMDYDSDSLVIFMRPDVLANIGSLFIELNEIQDTHEYEGSFTVADLKTMGLSQKDKEWSAVVIPLSALRKNLKEGMGETVRLHNCRLVLSGLSSSSQYLCHLDHICLVKTEDVDAFLSHFDLK